MKKDKLYLQHILEAIADIENFLKNINKEAFSQDREKQYAVIRALEIIGEATKNVTKEVKKSYAEIPWKDIAGMRDILIHQYFGVNIELMWETIQVKLPELKEQINKIMKKL
ncbi:MAG: DUF86 domain-containing protein [Elusimicrobia bacterium]|nr:DUF86 domain-containing protein [Elusimicrobiota bacterium]